MPSNQTQVTGGHDDEPVAADVTASGQVQFNTAGTDDLLAEIDGLLESNAAEFVRAYVQKGGQ